MLVLGIDPGDPTGWAVVTLEGGEVVASGEVSTKRNEPLRLALLASRFRQAVRPYSELDDEIGFEVLVCESLFVGKNWKNAMNTSARRGAILGCVTAGTLYEPNPRTWMGQRKPHRLEIEARALKGGDVLEHERDALLQAVWGRRTAVADCL